MTIIIEGPDGAGKTTLAKFLAEAFGLDYHHEGPPPEGSDLLRRYCGLAKRDDLVIDRCAMGELIYGPLLRGKSDLALEDFDIFQDVCRANHVRTILCLPPRDVCFDNWSDPTKTELFDEVALFDKSYERWRDIPKRLYWDYILHDYTIIDSRTVMNVLKRSP